MLQYGAAVNIIESLFSKFSPVTYGCDHTRGTDDIRKKTFLVRARCWSIYFDVAWPLTWLRLVVTCVVIIMIEARAKSLTFCRGSIYVVFFVFLINYKTTMYKFFIYYEFKPFRNTFGRMRHKLCTCYLVYYVCNIWVRSLLFLFFLFLC